MYLIKTKDGKVKDVVFTMDKQHSKQFLLDREDKDNWDSYSLSARILAPSYKTWTEFDRIDCPLPSDILGWQIRSINLICDRAGKEHMIELIYLSPHRAKRWVSIDKFALMAYELNDCQGIYDEVDLSLDKRRYCGSIKYLCLQEVAKHLNK